ncbi:unnamed protein product [Diabrotica balteata]|uniref:Uncharacterized protein n=1 Tax=Diabrotica balteata TaxID=107213 RepID=A0A9N9T909_DIABA|nr:unnamed protein product [Diabrotica balteata]
MQQALNVATEWTSNDFPKCPEKQIHSLHTGVRRYRAKRRYTEQHLQKVLEQVTSGILSKSQLKVQAQERYCSQLNIEDVPSTYKSIGLNTNPTNKALELANSKEKIKLLNEQLAELLQIKSALDQLFTPRQLKRLQTPKIRTVWYTLKGWAQIIRLACTKPCPFEVTYLLHNEILDFNQRKVTFALENKIKPKNSHDQYEKENDVKYEEQTSNGNTNFKYSDGV